MANDFCEKNEQKDESGRKKKSGLKFAVLCASAILLFACAEAEKEAAQSPRVADGVQLSGVTALEISSDGKYMLSASADGLLRVWDIYTGKQLEIVKAGDKPAFSAAFSAQDGVQNPEGGARAVISGGARILTGGQDGSVLMSLAATGEEIARYVGFGQSAEDNEWICITAAGYFVTSKKGSALLTVQAGGEELTMDQFRESLHRPDLVAQILRGEELSAPQPESGEKSAPQDGVTLAALLREADKLPLIEIVGAVKRTSAESSEKVQVRITDRGQGVGKIMIYNGDLCSGLPGLDEVMTGRRESGGVVVYDAALTIDLKPGRNPIAISVFGSREHGAPESKKAKMEISTSWQPPAPVETRPVLHVFTTAIQKYAAEKLNLKYTKADAAALQKSLARQGTTGSRYAKVELYSLYDEEVTKEGLTRKFNEIKPRVRERDTFVFFFSGHGAVDDYKDFYFLPADADGWTIAPERTILKHDLLGNLLKIKAQNIFVMLDTCQSGALRNMTSAVDRVWTDLGQQANLAILMAAAGNQYAIESEEDAQGVLTWSVLRSLEGQAQRREERYVAASEMLEYVRRDAPVKAEQVVAKVIQERLRSGRADEPVSTPLGEVAVKGFFDAASLAQEPAVKPPEKNFDLFDLKWRPAKVTLSARTAGELTIKGEGPVQKVSLDANKPKTVSLRDGAYEFAMLYKAAAPPETIRKDIVNETEVTIAFVNTAEVKRPVAAPAGFGHVQPGSFLMG
ncbi:MAG: caspase family protein, partial [Spirochaetales bacterium]|nr:caspase family protein [Spirochaetales bacterium]